MDHFIATQLTDLLRQSDADAGSTDPAIALETLRLASSAAKCQVPAYADLCRSGAGRLEDGKGTSADSSDKDNIPFTTKANYYTAFPLARRCWGGQLSGADFVHFSSGSSTGVPTPWARCADDEGEVAARFEQVLRDSFACHERSSVCVVALPLGSWVGGVFTTMCLRALTLKGYRLTVTTPGNRPPEIIQIIQSLGPSCDQTVILGYPPFVKGVIDEGRARGVEWGRYRLKLVLAGEVFSEEWRALVSERAGIAEPHRSVASIYGTADAGVLAQETALSATIRGWLAAHPDAARELFGSERLPTLAQYDPATRYFERHPEDGSLVVSSLPGPGRAAALAAAAAAAGDEAQGGAAPAGLKGAPVLRYCIGDAGGIMAFDKLLAFLRSKGFDPLAGPRAAGCAPLRRQPFVWVFGRSFWAVSLYGANVFVEQVMPALEGGGEEEGGGGGDEGGGARLCDLTTGKFVLGVIEDADLNPRLSLRVELAPGVAASEALSARVASAVLCMLRRVSSEYASYVPSEAQLPAVALHAFGDPAWFPVGVKHKYTAN